MDEEIMTGHEETFGGEEYVHFLDCNDGFKGTYISQNLPSSTV